LVKYIFNMNRKVHFFSYKFSISLLVYIFFFAAAHISYSQCDGIAGNDNVALDICDVTNISSKSINLNAQLGLHTTGGIWKDIDRSGGINRTTGILNAQLIRRSGTYRYSYTVTTTSGCSDTAIVTVRIGGYTGVPGANSSVCNTEFAYNLYEAFNGDFLPPQVGGTWVGNTTTLGLTNNTLNTTNLNPGNTYEYTYSIPAIGSCPAPPEVKIFVTIYRSPIAGIPDELKLCSNELNSYTNYNLFDGLTGEDPGGIWTETGTDEIDNINDTDSVIDIQNIYNTRGPGLYRFTYTVFSDNNVCDDKTSVLFITLEKQLDYTGGTLSVNAPICENELASTSFTASIRDVVAIPNDTYTVTYTISGNTNVFSTTQNFTNNVFTFPIASSNFSRPGSYTITILNIVSASTLGICTNIIPAISAVVRIDAIPQINNATIQIDPICQLANANVTISGPWNLIDGDYSIGYTLSGSNSLANQSMTITVRTGVASFQIPASQLPNVGNTNFIINKITNLATNCTNTALIVSSFLIKALPDTSNLAVAIRAVCKDQPVVVEISGLGNLTAISISYSLSGANTTGVQMVPLLVNAGRATYTIPNSLLSNTGTTVFNLQSFTDSSTGCSALMNTISKDFVINPLPNVPLTSNQEFCKVQNATVASLVPNGPQYRWFNSLTSTTVLPAATVLQSTNYYVKEVNTTTGCESGLSLAQVVINELQTPVLLQNGEKFCGLDLPTIQSLSNNVTSNGTVVWYDAATGGNLLATTTSLRDNGIYYGFDSTSVNNCLSTTPLKVTVSLTNCNVTPQFFIPDGFSPNGDGVNETFSIPNIDFIYPNYALEIFNRYGSLVYTANRNKPKWDGSSSDAKTSSNGKAPEGVYFYVIHFNKDGISPKQGRLYLNR
jgi:gliding motility-associated-like protein